MARWAPGQQWHTPVAVVPIAHNHKTGNLAATHVAQVTCPSGDQPKQPACPFLGKLCYAERVGMQPFTTRRLNSNTETHLLTIAKIEAHGIDALPADRDLRVHVVGDCKTRSAARIVGAAMVRYEVRSRTQKIPAGFFAFTYCHAWHSVPYSSWAGARVMASIHDPGDVARARDMGYTRCALAVPDRHPSKQIYQVGGIDVLPCPAQWKDSNVRCYTHGSRSQSCDICKTGGDRVVAFQPDTLPKRSTV